MIQLNVNNTWLDLLPDTSINIKQNNPLFGTDVSIPGEYSLPFDLPLTGTNRKALGFPDMIENKEVPDRIDNVSLYFDNILFQKGVMRFGNIKKPLEGNGVVPAHFTFGLSGLNDKMKSKSIRDLATETITLFTPTYEKKVYVRFNNVIPGTESGDHEININGNTYSVDVTDVDSDAQYQSLRDAINGESEDNNCVATYKTSGGPWSAKHLELTPYEEPENIESPFHVIVGPLSVLIAAFSDEAWLVETNYEDHWIEFNSAVNDYLGEGTEPDDKIRFLPVQNDGIFEGDLSPDYPVNGNQNGDFLTNYPRSSSQAETDGFFNWNRESVNRLALVPFVKLSHIMDLMADTLGVTLVGDFLQGNAYENAVIFNMKSISVSVPFTSEETNTIFHKNSVSLVDHLPDLKINDFLKAIKSRFLLNIEYSEDRNELSLSYIEDILLLKTHKDITTKAGSITSLKNSEITSIKLSANQGTQDEIAKEETYSITTSNTGGEVELPSRLGSVVNERVSLRHGEIPWVKQREGEQKDFKLIFDSGVQLGFFWNLGGAASWNVRKSNNTSSPGFLFETTTKKDAYLNMLLKQKLVGSEPNLNIVDISNLRWEEKLRIGEINYLIHDMDITFYMSGRIKTKMMLSTVV